MLEMNHKQAEIVVARVLSEKMRLKNKTLIAEYKKLKAWFYYQKLLLRVGVSERNLHLDTCYK